MGLSFKSQNLKVVVVKNATLVTLLSTFEEISYQRLIKKSGFRRSANFNHGTKKKINQEYKNDSISYNILSPNFFQIFIEFKKILIN